MIQYLSNELHIKWLKSNSTSELSYRIKSLLDWHDVFEDIFDMEDYQLFHLSDVLYNEILCLMAMDLNTKKEKKK